MEQQPLLKVTGISKSFGSVKAVSRVDLDLNRGEILGLIGDNGAGKSTLVKVLAGVYSPDEGEILLEGKSVRFRNPKDARNSGIEMVFQDSALFGDLDVAANIFIARELVRGRVVKLLDKGEMARKTYQILQGLRTTIDSHRTKVKNLSGGQQRTVAIARSISAKTKIIIDDEPTAGLGLRQVSQLLDLLAHLRSEGISIILISHRLQDIFSIADRIMIMRDGQNVGCKRVSETTPEEIARKVVGAEFVDFHRRM